ncbi:MAG TPA: NAD-dependent epimerase/dehydratase family protein [Gaiellaceae bacterium]|jgi:nucleoside-diphosphate-sugar epimerase|nr:NAD-dependent epimerase/dehydratase family protein [Gaiellaceae bacterium]
MRVAVIGATGNVGTSVTRLLAADDRVESILGVARRRPDLPLPKTEWVAADVTRSDLAPLLSGMDVVVHLAWLIQPSHDEQTLRRVNVDGSRRVLAAVTKAQVPALVYASSVGAYSPGPKDRFVDESWPTGGIHSSFYSRHKAEVERLLDDFEKETPTTRVVRMRPGLTFKREAATGIRRLFAGPFLPGSALRPGLLPFLPVPRGLCFQAIHADDVAEGYRQAVVREVRGAFNLAADGPLDPESLAASLGTRPIVVNPALVRSVVATLWYARLQPTPPGWLDLALAVPLVDTSRAREELGWVPRHTGAEALEDLLAGLRAGASGHTPPLASETGGPMRLRELGTGVGGRDR